MVIIDIMNKEITPDLSDLNARYAAALVAGDLDALPSTYDADAIMLGGGIPAVEGASALEEYYTGVFGAGLTHAALTSGRSRAAGDVVIDTGRYEMTIEPHGGPTVHDAGKYVHVLRRGEDGGWRIWHDMFVSDGGA